MKNSRLGFLGAGNIAYAIVRGMLASQFLAPEQIYLYDPCEASLSKFDNLGVNYKQSACELVQNCDFLFFTVKPQVCPSVLAQIAPFFAPNQCLVTVCAGIPVSFFISVLGENAKIIRIMPNTPLLVGEGASAITSSKTVLKTEFEFVQGIFSACGTTQTVEEEAMSAVTAISGSGPAYFFYLAEQVCDWAQKNSLSSQIALELFCQTMQGAAKMMLESGNTPIELRQAVTSPNGTTQAALEAFEKGEFAQAFVAGLEACKRRSDELSSV